MDTRFRDCSWKISTETLRGQKGVHTLLFIRFGPHSEWTFGCNWTDMQHQT